MKPRFAKLSLFFLFILMALPLGGVWAATHNLTYATNTAPTGLRGEIEKMFLEEVEKATEGQVKITPYWGESLLKGREILKGVNDGIVNMGHVNLSYYPKRLPLHSSLVFALQGPEKYENKMWVFDQWYQQIPQLGKELDQYGQKVLFYYAVMPFGFSFTEPVNSVDDFKGKRIRMSIRWHLNILKSLNSTPVSIPWGDCYMALQTNAVEGVGTNWDSIRRAKLDEVAPNIFLMNKVWVPVPYSITINKRVWNKLPQNIKNQIEIAAQNARQKAAQNYELWANKLEEEHEKVGAKIVKASNEDVKKYVNSSGAIESMDTWLKEAKASGVTAASETLEKVRSIAAEAIAKE